MNQDQDLMSRMKRLKRVDQEGGLMSSEERNWFEETKKKSGKIEAQARAAISGSLREK